MASNLGEFVLPSASYSVGGGGDTSLQPEVAAPYGVQRKRERERENKRMEGTDRTGLYDNGLYRATVGPKLSCKLDTWPLISKVLHCCHEQGYSGGLERVVDGVIKVGDGGWKREGI